MKVLLLGDVPDGWIVSRISDRMVAEMPDVEFERGHYCCMTTGDVIKQAWDCDLIHFLNWNGADHLPLSAPLPGGSTLECIKPVLVSVRSHRFPPSFREKAKGANVHVHAISKALAAEFPGSTYIPDGVMLPIEPLVVGFAGKPGPYKGTDLIEAACRKIGAVFVKATDKPVSEMYMFYRDIDVLCCASEAEGFGAPVMEALALHRPVVSTRTGAAWEARLPGVTWVDRTVDSIADGLMQHWKNRHMGPFRWSQVCQEMRELYGRLTA